MTRPDGANETQGVVEVTRRRPIWLGIAGGGWKVFIDGVWVGGAPRGKTIRFPVTPGAHSVKVWSRNGCSYSIEVTLDFSPCSVRSLKCDVNAAMYRTGISQLPQQINTLKSIFRDGGVAKGGLTLYEEVPPLLT